MDFALKMMDFALKMKRKGTAPVAADSGLQVACDSKMMDFVLEMMDVFTKNDEFYIQRAFLNHAAGSILYKLEILRIGNEDSSVILRWKVKILRLKMTISVQRRAVDRWWVHYVERGCGAMGAGSVPRTACWRQALM